MGGIGFAFIYTTVSFVFCAHIVTDIWVGLAFQLARYPLYAFVNYALLDIYAFLLQSETVVLASRKSEAYAHTSLMGLTLYDMSMDHHSCS